MNAMQLKALQLVVARILERADQYQWSIQGLRMLRLYLSPEVRLHIWLKSAATQDVSTIHNHPWDFESQIISGWLVNRVYRTCQTSDLRNTHMMGRIRCGVGGGLVPGHEAVPVNLQYFDQTYVAGDSYIERAEELHESLPEDGTVTIITRKPKADLDHATVCWPLATEWVSAEPRPATPEEVARFAAAALERLHLQWGPSRVRDFIPADSYRPKYGKRDQTITFRGSASDLATDVVALLDAEQANEFIRKFGERCLERADEATRAISADTAKLKTEVRDVEGTRTVRTVLGFEE